MSSFLARDDWVKQRCSSAFLEGSYYNKKEKTKKKSTESLPVVRLVDGKNKYRTDGLKIYEDKERKPVMHAHSYFCHAMSPIE